uniref:Uncharacterized protein n=1 Tax=Arundo donax TaxID=35708 RepID=A0A0A8ZNB5_ARUDO
MERGIGENRKLFLGSK